MKYQIRYQHTSWAGASSVGAARAAIKTEGRSRRLYYADCADGLFCYLSAGDKAKDTTGAHAFAVICGPKHQQ